MKPRCFSGMNMSTLPVHYYSQKKGWMVRAIFTDWFFKHFVPEVKQYLQSKSLPPKALLLLDNVPSHPPISSLISMDGGIKCLFLPPNVTSLIQPMDQGVLENIERKYKRDLLRKLLLQSSDEISFIDFTKTLTIKDAVYFSSKCWNEVSSISLCRAWNKVGLGPNSTAQHEDMMPGISEEYNRLDIDESEGEAWLNRDTSETGAEEMTDEEIIGVVQGDDDSEEEEEEDNITQPTVTHTEAEAAFSICLSWLEQQAEATPMNLMLLRDPSFTVQLQEI